MKQIIKDYHLMDEITSNEYKPLGNSAAPKEVIFHILENNSVQVDVLDIGFGTGSLGTMIKMNPSTQHWQVDGIDGWEANCKNIDLFEKKYTETFGMVLPKSCHQKEYPAIKYCVLSM